MTTELYLIKDTIADELGPIFEAKNDAVAARNYKAIIKKSPFPNDFLLIHVGNICYTDPVEGDEQGLRYITLNEDVRLVDANIIEKVENNG